MIPRHEHRRCQLRAAIVDEMKYWTVTVGTKEVEQKKYLVSALQHDNDVEVLNKKTLLCIQQCNRAVSTASFGNPAILLRSLLCFRPIVLAYHDSSSIAINPAMSLDWAMKHCEMRCPSRGDDSSLDRLFTWPDLYLTSILHV